MTQGQTGSVRLYYLLENLMFSLILMLFAIYYLFYINEINEIILKYHLEKIKTIGDAYMAVGGVGTNNENIELKTALAALEIRNFIQNENNITMMDSYD